MTNRQKIIDKILKCMALSKSANEHEAALAMARAQELMQKHDVSRADVELAEISSQRVNACRCLNPPNYIMFLVDLVEGAFRCRAIFEPGMDSNWRYHNDVLFVGSGPNPQIASYAFAVLQKQLRQGRQQFLAGLSKRMKRSNKVMMADNWAEGWMFGVSKKVHRLVISGDERALIDRWVEENCGALEKAESRSSRKKGRRSIEALLKGVSDGNKATLHKAVDPIERALLQ